MIHVKMRRNRDGVLEVERFSAVRRVEHWFAAVTFIMLIVTGFPQMFDHWELGHWILGTMGGLENARWLHRVFGLLFCGHAVLHLGAFVVGTVSGRMRMTMAPTPQDARDAWQMLLYFIGMRKTRPDLPKFDYRQKFEYMGMVLGGLVMVSSGLVLMYPLFVVQWLPGAVIPIAQVMHSSEAMLAFTVLVVWHVYGASLNPEVFPIDKTMFTGYMDVHHLEKLHGREFKTLFPDGLPEDGDSAPPPVAGRRVTE